MRLFLFAAVIALTGAVIHSGMGSAQQVQYAATQAAVAVPSPAPSLNPDLAAGIVTRFYRDLNTATKAAFTDLASRTSSDFDRRHTDDLNRDYGFIEDPKIQIAGVHGRTVNYVLDYDYVSDTKTKFFWERSGQWTFNHGAQSGWVLDDDKWNSVHLVGFQTPDQPSMVPLKDVVFSDGRHEFDYMGSRFAFVTSNKGWKISPVSTPPPAPVYPTTAADSPADASTTAFDPTTAVPETNSDETTQTHFDDPQTAQEKCTADVVVWVNTNSGVFHFPGTRWYGATANGTYECEADAVSEGDRPSRNGQ